MLLAAVTAPFAAGRHGTGGNHFARGVQPRAVFGARREVRRSAESRAFMRAARSQSGFKRRREARSTKRVRRHEQARVSPAITEPRRDLASLPHRFQRMPEGQQLPPPVPRQILVFIDQEQPLSLGGELARIYGLERINVEPVPLLRARAELMRVRGKRSQEIVLAALQRDPRVRSAQLNQRYLQNGTDAASPQRPGGLVAPIPQWGPLKIALPEAHQLALGRNVLIAVIDSTVDTTHPELQGAVVRSFNAAGREDAAPDFHGTAVAGIIRAHGLIESAAPESQILAVRAFRTNSDNMRPETTTHMLVVAVDWAVSNGAKILNMSFVGTHDPALQQLLRAANEQGVVVVAAAGNGGPTAPPVYPAAYPGVIAVTALDEADRPYAFANRGGYIAVAAPGVDILAPVERGGYAFVSGTSFAAAYVSGIAALLLERDPTLDPKAVADLIAAGAEDLGPAGRDNEFGAGVVNANASLKLLGGTLTAKRPD